MAPAKLTFVQVKRKDRAIAKGGGTIAMSDSLPIKLAGGAGVCAGLMRLAEEYLTTGAAPLIDSSLTPPLYPLIDALILVALIGVVLATHKRIGFLGLLGFAIAAFGVVVLRLPQETIIGLNRYVLGAGLVSGGAGVMGAMMIAARALPWWIGAFWIASFGCAVLVIFDLPISDLLRRCAVTSFSLGLLSAGFALLAPKAWGR
jgi:hypothetical protein